jgi:hypothetical protein
MAPLFFLALLAAAPPDPRALFPCTPGLAVTYALERSGQDTGARRTETVKGPGRAPRTCLLERRDSGPGRAEQVDAWLLEHLPDRVANAGWAATPTAFRPPLLKAPLEVGRSWTFESQLWRVEAVGERVVVPAGTFDGCVVVEERSLEGAEHRARVVYAPGVGPVLVETRTWRRVAVRVTRPATPSPRRRSGPTR